MKHGARAEMLPLSARLQGFDVSAMARDAKWIAQVDAASGVYFTGGAQERITAALLEKDGGRTPLLAAIWRLYVRGGVVAGSSAGAAIMSATMFREPPDNMTVLRNGAKHGSDIDRGLGFVSNNIFVDQHFLKRGRIGRMLPVMLQERITFGIGVEEDTAAVICGNRIEAVGARGVLLVDMRDTFNTFKNKNTSNGEAFQPFMAENVRLTYLDDGDSYQLQNGTLTVSAAKKAGTLLQHTATTFKPYYTSRNAPHFYADILGDNTILSAMSALSDSEINQVHGLAFAPTIDKVDNIGFSFRLYKNADTITYVSNNAGTQQYSIYRMGLDVLPVRMATPLFTPLALPEVAQTSAAPVNGGKQAKMPD